MNTVDITTARGLPNDAYVSDSHWRKEIDRLFSRTWTCIGFASDVPGHGDVHPVSFAGLPFLLLRDREGQIRVFHNVCPHRGMRVVREPGRNKRSLACPYHCWTYKLDGTLLRRPFFEGPEDQEGKTSNENDLPRLTEVRSAQWLGVVFINIDGMAEPFEKHIQDIQAVAKNYGELESGKPAGSLDFDIAANWKLITENFVDSYHLPWVHKNSLEPSTPMVTYEHEFYGNLCIGRAPMQSNRPGWGSQQMPVWPGLSEVAAQRLTYVVLFPNTLVVFTSTRISWFMLNPVTPDQTLESVRFFVPDPNHPAFVTDRDAFIENYTQLNSEDVWVVEELQRSRHSPAFDGGRFSPHWDGITHHLSKLVAEAVGS